MEITEIYSKYQIPPNLQEHMFRVAGLARLIANSWKGPKIDVDVISDACLLHDLGNIIKFDFENFPELLGTEQKNIAHWKDVKKGMQSKYGLDEDVATVRMIEELEVRPEVKYIVENWGFKNFKRIDESENIEWKICVYADHRVSPNGIVTLEENLENKRKRYALSRSNASHLSQEAEGLLRAAKNIEDYISQNCSIKLYTITTTDIEFYINE
jgi:hypothetical protein